MGCPQNTSFGSWLEKFTTRPAPIFQRLAVHDDPAVKIQRVLGNHGAHSWRETPALVEAWLMHFAFVLAPRHGFWLNLVAMFIAKLARPFRPQGRPGSLEGFGPRLLQYLDQVNRGPVPSRW